MPKTTAKTTTPSDVSVAQIVGFSLDASEKTRDQIAKEAGFNRGNVLSMIRNGQMPVPLRAAPKLAIALGLDPATFVRRVLSEQQPELLGVIDSAGFGLLSTNEVKIMSVIRSVTKGADPGIHSREQERDFARACRDTLVR